MNKSENNRAIFFPSPRCSTISIISSLPSSLWKFLLRYVTHIYYWSRQLGHANRLTLCRNDQCDGAKFDPLSCCVARFLARSTVGHAVFSLDHVLKSRSSAFNYAQKK